MPEHLGELWFAVHLISNSNLVDFFPGDHTKFDPGAMHEFPVRPHPFPNQIVCGHTDCGHIFMDYFRSI